MRGFITQGSTLPCINDSIWLTKHKHASHAEECVFFRIVKVKNHLS